MTTTALERVREIFREAPFVVDLGIEPVAIEPGRCETVLMLQPRMRQHTGQGHAGVVTTLADHTAGAAAQSMIDGDGLAITVELKLSLLRPAVGDRLVCRAHVIKPGRQFMFTEAEVFAYRDGTELLVAKLSATMAVVLPR
jgi:uncharacterized protein (TIGR00369 family)